MSKGETYYSSISLRLIRWLCRKELQEEIEGNLLEFRLELRQSEIRFSRMKYWFQVLNYLRPSTLKKFNHSKRGNMFNFNPIFTIRSLFKQGVSSLINILGFALGLVCVLFLYFHIQSEISYDDFHQDKDQIYRAIRIADPDGERSKVGVSSGPYAQALLNDFPNSIKSAVRAMPSDVLVTFENKSFIEEQIILADSNFFSFFSYPLIRGNRNQVLNGTNNVVLGKEAAYRYFGDEDPIGKIIKIDNQTDYMVTGVMDEFPSHSHLEFSMVININVLNLGGWWNNGLITYVKIETPEEANYVNSQLTNFMNKYFGDDFEAGDFRMDLELEALGDVHFNNDIMFDFAAHGNKNTIYILGAVGLAILLIACFNYVNLSIAQSFRRAKEIAVRKVLGGEKTRLILQFLGESITILLFATGIAVGLAILLNPTFNNYFELDVRFDWLDPNLLIFGGILLVTTLLIAGLYPALLLSSFDALKVLKGSKVSSGKNSIIRKSLVVLQFFISIFMISATLLISQQMSYVQQKDLGFDKEAIVLIDINNGTIRSKIDVFKKSFEDEPDIISFTSVGGEPGGFHDITLLTLPESPDNHRINIGWGDEDYFETFGVNMVAGRSFEQNLESDRQQTAVLNLKAVEMLGFTPEEVLEKKVTVWNNELRVIGVSDNYNFSSLKQELEPLIIVNGLRHRRFAIKINASKLSAAMETISKSWDEFSPDYPMQYEFLDESIARLYESEAKQSRVFSAFSTISIFLACMGVFGLATYTARQRQKELGIRKVLGATANQIINLLSKEFILLILIASILATPVAWYFIDSWLNEFAYQISISGNWLVFAISTLAVGIIAFVTIGLKTYRAAVSNPTESIRYE